MDVEFPPGQLPGILDALEVQDFDGENVEASLDRRLKGTADKHSVSAMFVFNSSTVYSLG